MDTSTELNSSTTDATIYDKYHSMQKKDALHTLRKYEDKLNWNMFTEVMDLGCGPADFTRNHLLPLLPQNGKITAIDVSPTMINYARNRYNDERLKFDVADVQNSDLVQVYSETFDMIFSSYCLHWLPNQRLATANIFSMVKRGGHFVTLFLASSPVCTLFEMMATMEKWKPYMSNMESLIFPYHHDPNPQQTFRTILTDVGFVVHDCIVKQAFYTFPNMDVLLRSMNAAVSFVKHLPKELIDDYHSDCLSVIERFNLYAYKNNGRVTIKYTVFNVHCTKPDIV